jgi:hypothetical protein
VGIVKIYRISTSRLKIGKGKKRRERERERESDYCIKNPRPKSDMTFPI